MRVWIIRIGDIVFKVVGEIYIDFEKGFIRVKVVFYDNFIKNLGWKML